MGAYGEEAILGKMEIINYSDTVILLAGHPFVTTNF